MTCVGPTILQALGISDQTFGDQRAMTEIFK